MEAPYDIFKRDATGTVLWVESVRDMEAAKARMRELAMRTPAEYVVFDQRTSQVIDRVKSSS
jgi:hypothetical protein